MKIVFAGKGGVGKTTVCSLVAFALDTLGYKVLAIDADPDANLAQALGVVNTTPLASDRAFLASIVGVDDTALSGFFILNTFVDKVIERFGKSWGNQSDLISLGWAKSGGEGCYCTENTALRSIIRSVPQERYDVILIDGEAGLEHLSRGLSAKADVLISVLQAGQRSLQTARDAKKLASDIEIKHSISVLSGHRNEVESAFLEEKLGESIAFKLPYLPLIRESDMNASVIILPKEWQKEVEIFAKELIELGKHP